MRVLTACLVILSFWREMASASPKKDLVAVTEPQPAPPHEGRPKLRGDEDKPPLDLPGEKEFVGCKKYPDGKRFRWGVRGEVGVTELVASLGEISCQAMVINPLLATRAGKVSLQVPDLLTADEVYRLFYSSLEVMGLTIERSGKVWKIVDGGRGRELSSASSAATPGDAWVTKLVRLTYARPAEIADILAKIRGKEGEVTPYAPGRALLVTDRASNVRRMEEIVSLLDAPRTIDGDRIFLVSTHRQGAAELGATLEKILAATRRDAAASDGKAGSTPATAILADGVSAVVPIESVRGLAIIGSEIGFHRVLSLLQRIDPPLLPGEEQGGQAHVVYLLNTNAEEMAATLGLLGLGSRGGLSPAPGAPRPVAPQASSAAVSGDVRIAPDKVANALVVVASNIDFPLVRDLIARLDVPRRQVYVEATILDVSVDRNRSLGLSFHWGGQAGTGTAFGSSSSSTVNSAVVDASQLAGLLSGGGALAGILGPSVTIAGQSVPSFGVVLKALEQQRDIHVLSRPHLLTIDNIKSTLSVGQTFPYLASSLGAAGSATNSVIQTYAKQEVALKMDLTPHLNDSDSVRLEIEAEISDVPEGASVTTAGGPITNKRTIKTQVVVQDGEVVVLGGLQKESDSETVDKVPFLGDIPVLGRLFQTKTRQRIKQDLLIILQPRVIRGPEDLRRIHAERESEQREFLERYSAFRDERIYESRVDYRRKRGLLEEIRQTSLHAETEARSLAEAKRQLRRGMEDGIVE